MLLSCRNLKKSFGDQVILNGIDLDVRRGDRIGLVGRNGTGKTTLVNILSGNLDYDEGSLIIPRPKINIGYLRQAEPQPELMVNVRNSSDEGRSEFRRLTSRLGIQRIENWSKERLDNLSGGERTKMALAQVWASQPDLIILDEPTNHMDYQGIAFLVSELNSYPGTVIIISHDRYFLDRTVSQIAEIEQGTIRMYQGNYSSYREARRKERESRQHTFASQQKERQKIEDAITQLKTWSDKAHRESRRKAVEKGGRKEHYRNKAKKKDQAVKSQIKRLEKMRWEEIERPAKETSVNFNLSAHEKGGRRLFESDGISKAYGELVLFQDSSFYINRGEKMGVLGTNGCGKTTLVKAILGEERLDAGKIFLSGSARVAYVSQDLPQGEKDSLKNLIKEHTLTEQKRAFQLLINLGIAYDRLQIALGDLSRGERMKISMGLAIMGDYDLLILDEPTNHLDLYSREALEESLTQFAGSILLISHDRYLLERVCGPMLVFDKQRIIRTEGRREDYPPENHVSPSSPDSDKKDSDEELLLLETKISRVLSELSLLKPGEPNYAAFDQEYQELLRRRDQLK